MKKPELVVTPRDLNEIEALIEAGADAFIIGDEKFALRLAGHFNRDELRQAVELKHYRLMPYVSQILVPI